MKSILIYIPFIFLIFGCTNSEKKTIENPVEGKVYEFVHFVDLQMTIREKIEPEFIAFLNNNSFCMSYNNNYTHFFIRGNYTFEKDKIQLRFEELAYNTEWPNVPATSAVDTIKYEPSIIESKSPFMKLELSLHENNHRLSSKSKRMVFFVSKETSLTNFIDGLKLQKMEFLLDTKTINIYP